MEDTFYLIIKIIRKLQKYFGAWSATIKKRALGAPKLILTREILNQTPIDFNSSVQMRLKFG